MIDRTPEFLAAQDRVKVGHFTRKGFDITGVVHVGANDGYEIPFYIALGAKRVVAFEPLVDCCAGPLEELRERYNPIIEVYPQALSDRFQMRRLHVSAGDGKGSTFLEEKNSQYSWVGDYLTETWRFDDMGISMHDLNTLVVDVQGMELQVLRGFGNELTRFQLLNIECSRVPLYEGEAPAKQVIAYLENSGFAQDSPIEDHDDIMFIKRSR